MGDAADNFDFNSAGEQRSRDVIPDNTICTVQMTIRPGGAGPDGYLKTARDGASEHLDCEFTVTEGPHAKRRFWQPLTLRGVTPKHAESGEINRNLLRAILESARGIRPDDKSEAAQAARKTAGWQDFDGLRFVVRVGVIPPKDGYGAKNCIREVVTPERQAWVKPEQVAKPSNNGAAPQQATTMPPANAIARPEWGR